MCTGCNACKDFCPSKINAKEIFIAAKAQYYKNNKISLKEKIVNSYVLFKTALCCAFIFFSVYRFLRMDKIIKKTIIGVMLCVACITICACNGKEKIKETTAVNDNTYIEETTNQEVSTNNEESTQDALDEAIKQLEELNDILKD